MVGVGGDVARDPVVSGGAMFRRRVAPSAFVQRRPGRSDALASDPLGVVVEAPYLLAGFEESELLAHVFDCAQGV